MNPFLIILLFIHFTQGHLFIGVVDRVEGDKMVILVEDMREEVIMERREQLEADKWYLFYWKDKKPRILSPLPELETKMKNKSEKLLEQLRNKDPVF